MTRVVTIHKDLKFHAVFEGKEIGRVICRPSNVQEVLSNKLLWINALRWNLVLWEVASGNESG